MTGGLQFCFVYKCNREGEVIICGIYDLGEILYVWITLLFQLAIGCS